MPMFTDGLAYRVNFTPANSKACLCTQVAMRVLNFMRDGAEERLNTNGNFSSTGNQSIAYNCTQAC